MINEPIEPSRAAI